MQQVVHIHQFQGFSIARTDARPTAVSQPVHDTLHLLVQHGEKLSKLHGNKH